LRQLRPVHVAVMGRFGSNYGPNCKTNVAFRHEVSQIVKARDLVGGNGPRHACDCPHGNFTVPLRQSDIHHVRSRDLRNLLRQCFRKLLCIVDCALTRRSVPFK
jgi:hypothetical protein